MVNSEFARDRAMVSAFEANDSDRERSVSPSIEFGVRG